ncbi:MAG: hypothetical protein CL920_21680 [Deltaproteobacteria bacterium]|nr:hypothetical protein [Deltaproteobacteria bacterium]MBU51308.1 hypothetical protein [Deltaproteobacteria bacterium]
MSKRSTPPPPNPRRKASQLLQRVLKDEAFTNRLLDTLHQQQGWKKEDIGLITQLIYGVLRHLYELDNLLEQTARKGLRSLDPSILAPLRIAIFEMLYLDRIPERASVSEAVKIVKKQKGPKVANLVNAILRRIQREKESLCQHENIKDPLKRLQVQTSHPHWLIKRYIKQMGEERAHKRLLINNQQPPLTLRVQSAWGSVQDLQALLNKKDIESQPTVFSPDGLRVSSSLSIGKWLKKYPKAFIVQDEAAQLLAHWLAPQEGEHILDICAAPGGKTTHIASLAPAAHVTALDLHPHRIELIRQNCERLGLHNVKLQVHDATMPLPPHVQTKAEDHNTLYNKILLDAPCSGLGVLRRHPEIRYNRNKEQIKELASLQRRLLDNAAAHLKDDGVLLYSVCTDTKDETTDIIESFLERHPHFVVEPGTQQERWPSLFDAHGYLWTTPEDHDMDAFFAVRLRNKRTSGE